MNRWGIPKGLETEVRRRDKRCVYCGVSMRDRPNVRGVRKDTATWEHMDNRVENRRPENIARCCGSCNSSKGAQKLQDWFKSGYCKGEKINADTVADVVKKWLRRHKHR